MKKTLTVLAVLTALILSPLGAPVAQAIPGPEPGPPTNFDIYVDTVTKDGTPKVMYEKTLFDASLGWDFGDRAGYNCAWAEFYSPAGDLDFEVHQELFQYTAPPTLEIEDHFGVEKHPDSLIGDLCGNGTGGASPDLVYSEAEYGDHHPHADVENTGDLVFYKDLDSDGFVDDEFARIDYDDPDNCDEGYWTPGNSPGEAVFWWDADGPQQSMPGIDIPCPGNGPGEPAAVLLSNVKNVHVGVGYCVEDSMDGDLCQGTSFQPPADTVPPVIAAHGNETAEATSSAGAVVSYTSPGTTDNVDPPGTATCSPASGSQFALGNTTVTCSASDAAGNAATPTTFVVSVVDTTPPVIASHADETAQATSPSGATVTYASPITSDIVDGAGVAACTPASGSQFAIGDTTVTCNSTDAAGNAAVPTTFVVHVLPLSCQTTSGSVSQAVTSGSSSGSGAAWANPGYITANDALVASAALLTPTTTAQLLGSLPALSVPSDATITGITVSVDRFKQNSGDTKDLTIQLAKAGVAVGDNKANLSLNWPSVDTTAVYGSNADLWGTTWTVVEVNSGLGVVIAAQKVSGAVSPRVDYVTITVYYTRCA